MSGPTTVILTAEPLSVILAASAIRAAEAIRSSHEEAAQLRDAHAAARQQRREEQAAANAAGEQALREQIEHGEQRYAQLCQLAVRLNASSALPDTAPQRPNEHTHAALAAYAEQLQSQNQHLTAVLGEISATPVATDTPGLDLGPDTRTPVLAHARLLARLGGLSAVPEHLEALAAELAACRQPERSESLAIELRLAIQRFEETLAQSASALVLEQTLKDLGYQVEAVSETLFVDGGIVHFRRADWGDYQVRMRLNSAAKTANFNVVRAVDAANNDRSVLDHLAEDRWCAEFPALLQALAGRGLQLAVSRRLGAGELPVQMVERSRLPHFADEEHQPAVAAALQKNLR